MVLAIKVEMAKLFQYSASGCVIRDCEFEDSDAQFHAGYPHENLIENCQVISKVGNGSYGFGLWKGAWTRRSVAALVPDLTSWPNRPRYAASREAAGATAAGGPQK